MSFRNLKVDELKSVADFFVVDVEVADEEHGPTKKELIAALSAGKEPVTWEQYNEIYLVAQAEKSADELPENAEAEVQAREAEKKAKGQEPPVLEKPVVVKFEGKNPRLDIVGLTFTKQHPFASVDEETAVYLVQKQNGFRVALPSEVAEYYDA